MAVFLCARERGTGIESSKRVVVGSRLPFKGGKVQEMLPRCEVGAGDGCCRPHATLEVGGGAGQWVWPISEREGEGVRGLAGTAHKGESGDNKWAVGRNGPTGQK